MFIFTATYNRVVLLKRLEKGDTMQKPVLYTGPYCILTNEPTDKEMEIISKLSVILKDFLVATEKYKYESIIVVPTMTPKEFIEHLLNIKILLKQHDKFEAV